MPDDLQLLRDYVVANSEAAFSELVRRHLSLVYSAALRMANGNAHEAQDVAQQVFMELAHKADRLCRHPALVGWLYTTTRRVSLRRWRTARRRAEREREAHRMNELEEHSAESNWPEIQPFLDEAMGELGEKDRLAVLLRYFQNQSLADVGSALGLKENAARMRVERALEKLRTALRRRGIRATAGGLALLLSAEAVSSAPAALVVSISSAALLGAAAAGSSFSLLTLMPMTALKTAAVAGLVLAGTAIPLTLQHKAITSLRQENATLRGQLDALASTEAEIQSLSNRVADATRAAAAREADLARLRGEVTRLRGATNELAALRQQNAANRAAVTAAQLQQSITRQNLESLSDAKCLALAMLLQSPNGDRFPGDFANASSHYEEALRNSLNPGDPAPDLGRFAAATNNFEIVYEGPISTLREPATTILLRQRHARQLPDGQWTKVYAFTDGHTEIRTQPDSNFAAFENEHLFRPTLSGTQ